MKLNINETCINETKTSLTAAPSHFCALTRDIKDVTKRVILLVRKIFIQKDTNCNKAKKSTTMSAEDQWLFKNITPPRQVCVNGAPQGGPCDHRRLEPLSDPGPERTGFGVVRPEKRYERGGERMRP